MHMHDCEISTREVRGQHLVILYGARELSAAERAALLDEFIAAHGTVAAPVYASPGGWQLLEPLPAVPPPTLPTAQPPDAKPSAAP